MPDVSCRAFSWFQGCAELGLIDLEAVIRDAPVPLEVLEDPTQRVPWEAWMELTDRAVAQLGDVGLEASGAAVKGELAGALMRVAPLVADPAAAFRIGLNYVAPSLYRPVHFDTEDLPDGRLRITVHIPPPFREGLAWLRCLPPAMRRIPAFLGLPEAVVVVESLQPRRIVMAVTPPASRSMWARLRRALAGAFSGGPLLAELDHQQRQLDESWRALSESERGFRAVLDALPAGVLVHQDGRVLHTNAALQGLLGRSGNDIWLAVPPEHRDDWAAVLSGAPRALSLLHADGRRVPVLAHGIAGIRFSGQSAGVIFLLDRGAERTAHALHEATPDLVLHFEQGRLMAVHAGADHDRAQAVMGPLIGMELTHMLAPFQGSLKDLEVRRGLEAFERARTERTQEVVPVRSTFLGDRSYEARILPLGPGDEVLIIVRDTTELATLQRQLVVSERMASVGSLAAGVAHEINNPLTYVAGNLAWALEELGDGADPVLIGALQDALEGSHRVERIVRQLRDLSRPQPPDPDHVDVGRAVQTATDLVGNELRHAARLQIDLGAAPPAFVDEPQLVQVLVNLLLNAAQAIEAGSAADHTISIAVDTDPSGDPRVRVQDTGHGMSEEVQARLFDPFFTTKKSSGTGLGLAISQRILDQAGGRISVESAPGEGATFTLTLPRGGPAREAPVAQAPPEQPRGTIVVVDDDAPVGRAIQRLLQGHDVHVTDSVEEALETIARVHPDLILCDVMMPHRDGIELYDALPEEDRQRVVFLTGGVFAPDQEARVAATGRPLLTKPLRPEEIRRQVDELLLGS